MKPSQKIKVREKFFNISKVIFVRFLKAIISQFLLMVKQDQEKHTQCSEVTGKMQYLSIWKRSSIKIRSSKTLYQTKIMQEWFPEQFLLFFKRSSNTKNKAGRVSVFFARFCKSTIKRSMIYSKTFQNQKLWIFISLKSMGFSSKGLLSMQ